MDLPVLPPLTPMLAKAHAGLPPGEGGDWWFEPKWDGFRVVVFRAGDEVELSSRGGKPLTRYFPEVLDPLRAALPDRAVVDGEIVVPTDQGLDFDLLGQRIHPAASRVERLAAETPAEVVAFDLLALGDADLTGASLAERRRALEGAVETSGQVHVNQGTFDRDTAQDWFVRFEGAGLDGVIAKPAGSPYAPGVRGWIKVKHSRTADVVVAGYRVHKDGNGVGSLMMGLYDDDGRLHSIGVASSFKADQRRQLKAELAALVLDPSDMGDHPWAEWADPEAHAEGRLPGAPSRWNGQKDLSFTPLRIERVAEVGYERVDHGRFRHTSRFLRWRPDREPSSCRYDQLEVVPPVELAEVLGRA
ncbi:ATP-dependent DNA ligase [Iamia sp.]|uniref:ATP-dependent DNA ligase n=1 Tax=Iamia sp. TaxID=2722710 RepID=UPI002CE64836|nr:ATP-dependent DNA ligase [Iamia sp.]HXH59225.1 ATP-dependent DNA ligase [Iamia sp.]